MRTKRSFIVLSFLLLLEAVSGQDPIPMAWGDVKYIDTNETLTFVLNATHQKVQKEYGTLGDCFVTVTSADFNNGDLLSPSQRSRLTETQRLQMTVLLDNSQNKLRTRRYRGASISMFS